MQQLAPTNPSKKLVRNSSAGAVPRSELPKASPNVSRKKEMTKERATEIAPKKLKLSFLK